MKEQFLDYNTALKLKELGFDEKCIAFYNTKSETSLAFCELFGFINEKEKEDYHINSIEKNCSAPLYQQIIDWFREKYGLHIDIGLDDKEEGYYNYAINLNWRYDGGTYYEARKLAILDAIKVVQDKENKSWRFPYETN
jgi:hypothetical protein